jgi:hypothetical protein
MTDKPIGNRIMDRAYMRDSENIEHTGEALVLAMLLKVRKSKNRTVEQEMELMKVLQKPKRGKRKAV